jgi:CubicO group peptidase (beta-lactamase class C family)
MSSIKLGCFLSLTAIPMFVGCAPATLAVPADYIALIEGAQPAADDSLGAKTIAELMKTFGVPGISVAVIRDFAVHWAKGYGVADVATGARVDTETLFQAASISKPVTAMDGRQRCALLPEPVQGPEPFAA